MLMLTKTRRTQDFSKPEFILPTSGDGFYGCLLRQERFCGKEREQSQLFQRTSPAYVRGTQDPEPGVPRVSAVQPTDQNGV